MPTAADLGVIRCRLGDVDIIGEQPLEAVPSRAELERWVNALVQIDHLSLLVGNGLPISLLSSLGQSSPTMAMGPSDGDLPSPLREHLQEGTQAAATAAGRGDANIEDWLRSAMLAESGLRLAGHPDDADAVRDAIDATLQALVDAVVAGEALLLGSDTAPSGGDLTPRGYLVAFLLSLGSRPTSRDRLHIFTTNYDRMIEWGLELAGIRSVDRFVGTLEPRFHSSRLEVDLHYNPPGMRGEPRALDGVVRLTKLHGSLDWRWTGDMVVRRPTAFGSSSVADSGLMIFPNAAKDLDTAFFPYADLFRDFSAAVCRPNSVLVVFGYGFGDSHLNRVIADMLSIPSTHLLVISYDDPGGRIGSFCSAHYREGQISQLIGPAFGSLTTAVDQILPRPAADQVIWRRAKLIQGVHVPAGTAAPLTGED
jgi:hypothetical protein